MIPNLPNFNDRKKLVIEYYNGINEKDRLKSTFGQLEFAHMSELLLRYLPDSPAKVCDIGGGTGEYVFLMKAAGYDGYLLDLVPKHIIEARERAIQLNYNDTDKLIVGDALNLPFEDRFFDAVFLSGPLYHLQRRDDRIGALREAKRVLKSGGVMVCYSITRYATLFYAIHSGNFYDPAFLERVKKEVDTGFRYSYGANSLDNAFFHLPEELEDEIRESGLRFKTLKGVIGPAWVTGDFEDAWKDVIKRNAIMQIAHLAENVPSLCPRIFAVAEKG